jgi:hypothetical protein
VLCAQPTQHSAAGRLSGKSKYRGHFAPIGELGERDAFDLDVLQLQSLQAIPGKAMTHPIIIYDGKMKSRKDGI